MEPLKSPSSLKSMKASTIILLLIPLIQCRTNAESEQPYFPSLLVTLYGNPAPAAPIRRSSNNFNYNNENYAKQLNFDDDRDVQITVPDSGDTGVRTESSQQSSGGDEQPLPQIGSEGEDNGGSGADDNDAKYILPICCSMESSDVLFFQCENTLSSSSKELKSFKRKTWTSPEHLVSTKSLTKFRFESSFLKCGSEKFLANLLLNSTTSRGNYFFTDGYLKFENEYYRPDEYCVSGLNPDLIQVQICKVNCSSPTTPCIQKCCGRDQIYSFGYGDNARGCVDVKRPTKKWFPTLYHDLSTQLHPQEVVHLNPHIIQKFPTSFKTNCRLNKTTVFPHGKGIAGFLSEITQKPFRNLEFRLRKDGWLLYGRRDEKGQEFQMAKKLDNYCIDGAQDYGESSLFINQESQTVLFLCSGGVDEAFHTKSNSSDGETIKTILKPKVPTTQIHPNINLKSAEESGSISTESIDTSSVEESSEIQHQTFPGYSDPHGIKNQSLLIINGVLNMASKDNKAPTTFSKPLFNMGPINPYREYSIQNYPRNPVNIMTRDSISKPSDSSIPKPPTQVVTNHNPQNKENLGSSSTYVSPTNSLIGPQSQPQLHQMPHKVSMLSKANVAQIMKKRPATALSQTTFNHNNSHSPVDETEGAEATVTKDFFLDSSSLASLPTCCDFSPDVNDGFTHHCRNRRWESAPKHGNASANNGNGTQLESYFTENYKKANGISYTPIWQVPAYFMTRDTQTSFALRSNKLNCGSGKFQFQGFIHNFEQERSKTSGEKKHGILKNGVLKYDNHFYNPSEYCINGLSPKIVEVLACKPNCFSYETPCIQKCCGLDEIYNLGLKTGNRGCQPKNLSEAKFRPHLYKDMVNPVDPRDMADVHPHYVQRYPPNFQTTCHNGITLAFPFSQEIAAKLTPADSAERGGVGFKHLLFRFRRDGRLIYNYPEPDGTSFDALYDRGEYCVDGLRDSSSEPFQNFENQTILFICASEPHLSAESG